MKMETWNRTDCGALSFEFRADQGAWLWRLASSCHDMGIVGAAATESEAAAEAHAALDELSARCRVAARGCDLREPTE
jgi:hypothetical protein